MTDQELKDLIASLVVSQAATRKAQDRTDAQLAANAIQFAVIENQLAEAIRKFYAISVRLGDIGQAEDIGSDEFFFNGLSAKPELGGIRYENVYAKQKSFLGKLVGEYDVVMVNGQSVALIEVKYAVHPNDIDKTIKGIANYRTLFPQHKDYVIYGAIAGFKIAPEVAEQAKERGLMVLRRAGEVMEVDAGEPRRF